jgi:hypothetical protein
LNLLEFLQTWGFAVIGVALVLVAFMVNWLAPAKRQRIRRAVLLYVLFVGMTAA